MLVEQGDEFGTGHGVEFGVVNERPAVDFLDRHTGDHSDGFGLGSVNGHTRRDFGFGLDNGRHSGVRVPLAALDVGVVGAGTSDREAATDREDLEGDFAGRIGGQGIHGGDELFFLGHLKLLWLVSQ